MPNELNTNTLEPTGDEISVSTEPEPVTTEPEPVSTEEAPAEPEPTVDATPDPAALHADIEALEARRKEAEEKALYWRKQKAAERAAYFKGRQEEPPTPAPEPEPAMVAPREEDFENYNEFMDAKVNFSVQQERQKWDLEAQEKERSREYQKIQAEFDVKFNRGFEKYPDFEEVALSETVPITTAVKEILTTCEYPEDVAYFLGKNRQEAIRISHLTPLAAAREIAKIEIQIANTPSAPTKKTTKAPDPIKPVGGGDTHPTKDPNKMTQAEYNAWRESQGAKPY